MRSFVTKALLLACVAALLAAFPILAAANPDTFTGEIMDSQCAAMGSHDMMMDKGGMGKGTNPKATCTKECVKAGGKYVLFDAANKKVYQLSDQTKPEKFAGEKVKVTGTLDGETIKVASIAKGS
jgi:hypothetical protein